MLKWDRNYKSVYRVETALLRVSSMIHMVLLMALVDGSWALMAVGEPLVIVMDVAVAAVEEAVAASSVEVQSYSSR